MFVPRKCAKVNTVERANRRNQAYLAIPQRAFHARSPCIREPSCSRKMDDEPRLSSCAARAIKRRDGNRTFDGLEAIPGPSASSVENLVVVRLDGIVAFTSAFPDLIDIFKMQTASIV